MALKELRRPVPRTMPSEAKLEQFITKGGSLVEGFEAQVDDHRLTLRIPQWLMDKIDERRKERVGKISRNLVILEILEQATKTQV